MASRNEVDPWPQHVSVPLKKNADLAALLRSAGPWTERTGLPTAAIPDTNATTATVTVLQHHFGAVSDEIAKTLVRAREQGHPAADQLAAVAARLGVYEVAAEAAAEPEPAPVAEESPTLT
jgi:hypothetical protein